MRKRIVLFGLLFLALTLVACSEPRAADFWEHWGDGKAELNGYHLSYPRYGEQRAGQAVSIFVTEGFSRAQKVKAERGEVAPSDEMLVLKHNCVKDFQTGIYDYNLMSMAFAAIEPYAGRPAGSLVKVSFSSQEWCGITHEERVFEKDAIVQSVQSYWLNDSVQGKRFAYPENGVPFDQVPYLVRGLFGQYLAAGKSVEVPYLPPVKKDRLTRKEPAWGTAVIARGAKTKSVKVPAGRFSTRVWTITPKNGAATIFYVDDAYPHRIVKWEAADGEVAELTGSARLKYWELKRNEDEKMLRKLGL